MTTISRSSAKMRSMPMPRRAATSYDTRRSSRARHRHPRPPEAVAYKINKKAMGLA